MKVERRLWGEKADRIAAEALKVGYEYTLIFVAESIHVIYNIEQLAELLDDEMGMGGYSEELLLEQCPEVSLPDQIRVVAMVPLNVEDGALVFGVVNFAKKPKRRPNKGVNNGARH